MIPELCVQQADGFPGGPNSECPPDGSCLEACCLPEGDCIDLIPELCIQQAEGFPGGPNSECPPDGSCLQACCLPNEDCVDSIPDLCLAEGGVPQGVLTVCDGEICTPPVPFDGDGDGDVDLLDFGLFQAAFTGPQ